MGIAGAIAALLAGSFYLGHYVADLQSGTRRQTAAISKTKDEFLTHLARYMAAKEAERRESTTETRNTLKLTNDMFVDLISRWWTAQQSFEGNLTLLPERPEIIRKSADPTKSRIVFADGTDWVIPPEIKQQVLERASAHSPQVA